MNAEKRENDESGSSDIEDVDSGAEGSPNVASATIPKKRGRPAKGGEKAEKKPASGRGRGRPAKNAPAIIDVGSDDETAVKNGSKKGAGVRGRAGKGGKPKVANAIAATGKGRGRPKTKRGADDDDGEEASPKKVKTQPSAKRTGGRPSKIQVSDDDVSPSRSKANRETSGEEDENDSKDDDDDDVLPESLEQNSSAEEENDIEYDDIDKKHNRSGGISADLAAA